MHLKNWFSLEKKREKKHLLSDQTREGGGRIVPPLEGGSWEDFSLIGGGRGDWGIGGIQAFI